MRCPTGAQGVRESGQPVLVHGHGGGGMHSYLFKCGNLAGCFDAARGDDRMGSRVAQPSKPFQVCPRHRAFTVYVCAQEPRAERFELPHHIFGLKRDAFAPAVDGDLSVGGVESDDDFSLRNCFCELMQESGICFAVTESGASNNDLVRAPSSDFFGTRDFSNAATDAHLHAELFSRTLTEFVYEVVVLSLAHGGIQVDDV